ncbi:MAG: bacillithiol system redox-active protein YtxJ [Candidatus Kerfeldbacteria bacterium]|jgi:monothiol bacilliredoxin
MKNISSKYQLDAALEKSNHELIILFKHSNTCPTSASAFLEIENLEKKIDVPIFKIVVQDYRKLSDKVEDLLEVQHESPQAILINQSHEKKIFNHEEITEDNLFEAVMNF